MSDLIQELLKAESEYRLPRYFLEVLKLWTWLLNDVQQLFGNKPVLPLALIIVLMGFIFIIPFQYAEDHLSSYSDLHVNKIDKWIYSLLIVTIVFGMVIIRYMNELKISDIIILLTIIILFYISIFTFDWHKKRLRNQSIRYQQSIFWNRFFSIIAILVILTFTPLILIFFYVDYLQLIESKDSILFLLYFGKYSFYFACLIYESGMLSLNASLFKLTRSKVIIIQANAYNIEGYIVAQNKENIAIKALNNSYLYIPKSKIERIISYQ